MTQSLRTPSPAARPIDRYRFHNGLQVQSSQSTSQSSIQPGFDPPKRNRRRGVVLSQSGWQKLVQADVLHNKFGKRYTHEQLSERSLLDVRTISRILSCEVKVDKNTLRTFFRTFNLQLEPQDYTPPVENAAEDKNTDSVRTMAEPINRMDNSPSITPELMPLVEDLLQWRQRMMEDCDRILSRLGLDRLASGNLQN